MRVLFVASEATPFAKTGGLADVSSALPIALSRLGCDVTLIIPAYREALENAESKGLSVEPTGIHFEIPIGTPRIDAQVFRSHLPVTSDGPSPEVLLISNEKYFDRTSLYGSPVDYADNAARFTFFSRAAMEVACRSDRVFDIIHCHDWQTGLVPAYQKLMYQSCPAVSRARTIMTIHNMAYQGVFWHWDMLLTGLDWKYFNWEQMEFYGQLNLLKTGIVFADAVSTVSPTYAREIQSAPGGCGLETLLASRSHSLSGIINGIDPDVWDPQTDPQIPHHYSGESYEQGKYAAKIALAARLGRAAPSPRPLIAFIGRFAEQKGVDLLIEMLRRLAAKGHAHFVVLGTGDPGIEEALRQVAASFPETIDLSIGFNESLAHLAQAAADMILVPSRYEPCGLTQLYAMRYGTIPIVRATGGLIDTVIDLNSDSLGAGTATGFVFESFDAQSLEQTVMRALETYKDRNVWKTLVHRVMQQDWSWSASARGYLDLYSRLLEKGSGLPRE